MPESFKVLVKELQSLGLDIKVLDKDGYKIELKEDDEDMDTFNLAPAWGRRRYRTSTTKTTATAGV